MNAIPSKDFKLHKFGCNNNVDGAADIWDGGGTYEFPLVAFATEIVGGASDGVNSDGVHGVKIEGLDINGVDITEVATLTNVTPVALTNSYYRINRMYVLSTGGVTQNSFNIVASHVGSATLSQITALEGQTLQSVYTVPANVHANLVSWNANGGRSGAKVDATMSMRIQKKGPVNGVWRTIDAAQMTEDAPVDVMHHLPSAVPIEPFSDVRVRCVAVNTDNLIIAGGFELEGRRV